MADGKFAINQKGAAFILKVEEDTLSGHVGYDLTQAAVSDIEMFLRKPDRARTIVGPFTATIRTGTTDEMQFVTTDTSFLDIDGVWEYRGLITETDGDTLPTRWAKAEVIE